MSFLAPWFVVAGAAAVALPILFHLFRRTPRGRMPFSTLMFLTPSPPRLTSRSRLENLPLLLLRALILVVLACAFGRPIWRQFLETQSDVAAGTTTAILLDTSASMRRADLWPQALAEARSIVAAAGPHDELSIATFDVASRPVLSLDTWRKTPPAERAALAEAALKELAPSWAATSFDQALTDTAEALDAFDQSSAAPAGDREKQIVLISDVQAGGRTTGLQAYEWPKHVALRVVSVATPSVNAGLQMLEIPVESNDAKPAGERPRVLVSNAATSTRESFELRWRPTTSEAKPSEAESKPDSQTVQTYVPPGQTRVVRTAAPPAGVTLRLELAGDDEPFDNTLWIVPPRTERLRVLHLSDEKPDDPQSLRYFLERAFGDTTGRRVVTVETLDPRAVGVRAPTERDLDDVPLVVLAVEELPQAWTDALAAWLKSGGVCAAVVTGSETGAWRPLLPAELQRNRAIEVSEQKSPSEYALLQQIDFRHPLFAPLADPRFSDFTKIRFWKHRALAIDQKSVDNLKTLAKFDSGAPAIVEAPLGAGRLILFASGWQPRESQLGVSSKFVPLVTTLVELGRRDVPAAATYDAGATIDLTTLTPGGTAGSPTSAVAAPRDASPWTVRLPDGKETAVPADRPQFTFAAGPGLYEVRSAAGLRRIAVNVAGDESKTAPLAVEAFEALGVRLARDEAAATPLTVAQRETMQAEELEAKQQFWRMCVLAALGLLIVETWYAGRLVRREAAA